MKFWSRKRHGPHVADEHVRKLAEGATTACPVAGCSPGRSFNAVKLSQHLIDQHALHLGKGQTQSKKPFVVKNDLSNLLSRATPTAPVSASLTAFQ